MKKIKLASCIIALITSASAINAQTLDVLVVLSADIIGSGTNGLGSEKAARDEVARLIGQANNIYDVNTNARLRMAGEITIPNNMTSLTGTQIINFLVTDATIEAARVRYRPDLVTMLVAGLVNPPGGILFGQASNIPTSGQSGNIPALRAASYSFTRFVDPLDPNFPFERFTYAHEAGHSMGLAHTDVALGPSWEPFSHGHRLVPTSGSLLRTTVVGSPAGFFDFDHRIAFLSDPNRTYTQLPEFNDVPTGTALNDNARTLLDSAQFINNIATDPFIFIEAPILDQEWRWFSWWGFFTTASFPWAYHLTLDDWLLVDPASTSTEDLFLYSSNKNYWLWTTSSLWPQVFNFFDNTWCDIFSSCP